MKTVTGQNRGVKGLKVVGVGVTALAIGAWILPSRGQMERVAVDPVHTDAEIAADVDASELLPAFISFPAEVQNGQYCVAYGIAWGGTPPYSFYWGGGGLDTWDGPLGSNQIAGAYFSGDGTLIFTVEDSSQPTKYGFAVTPYFGTDEYNPDCEG